LIFLLQTRASGAFTIKDIQVYGLPSDTDIKFTDNTVPSSYALFQNYPNPFNPVTKINFSIPLRGRVKLEIYDLLGQRISTLVNRELQPGNYTEMLDARNLSSGIYFYTLRSENVAITKKMILLK
jgi:hypothetical protein